MVRADVSLGKSSRQIGSLPFPHRVSRVNDGASLPASTSNGQPAMRFNKLIITQPWRRNTIHTYMHKHRPGNGRPMHPSDTRSQILGFGCIPTPQPAWRPPNLSRRDSALAKRRGGTRGMRLRDTEPGLSGRRVTFGLAWKRLRRLFRHATTSDLHLPR